MKYGLRSERFETRSTSRPKSVFNSYHSPKYWSAGPMSLLEFDEEIEVAALGVELTLGRRRPEQLQPPRAVLAAQRGKLRLFVLDGGNHGESCRVAERSLGRRHRSALQLFLVFLHDLHQIRILDVPD